MERTINSTSLIKIGFPKWNYESSFISRKVLNENFFTHFGCVAVTEYVELVDLLQVGSNLKFDYLYVDITAWRALIFLLREQGHLDMPFITILHSVYGQVSNLTQIAPFLRDDDVILAPSGYAKKSFERIFRNKKAIEFPYTLGDGPGKRRRIIRNDFFTIAYMGRIVQGKGIDIVLQALHEIRKIHHQVRFIVIGPKGGNVEVDHESEYYRSLVKLSKQLNVDEAVSWKGAITSEERFDVLSTCDVLVLPSTWEGETFGVVLIEALACGIPVITTKWAGLDEKIDNHRNGFVIDVRNEGGRMVADVKQLQECILTLVENSHLHQAMIESTLDVYEKFHFKVLMPLLVLRLRSGNKVIGEWDKIKSKRFCDFEELYTDEWNLWMQRLGYDLVDMSSIVTSLSAVDKLKEYFEKLNEYVLNQDLIVNMNEDDALNVVMLNKYLHGGDMDFDISEQMSRSIFEYICYTNEN